MVATGIHGERTERPVETDPPTTVEPIETIDPPPDPPPPVYFDFDSSCEMVTCEVNFGDENDAESAPVKAATEGGVSRTLDRGDMQWLTSRSQARWTKNGITVVEGRSTTRSPTIADPDMHSYGAWMQHSGFVVREVRTVTGSSESDSEFETRWRFALAGGDLTGSRPQGGGLTWTGVMVGTPADEFRPLHGDARLTYDIGADTVDVVFTDIHDAASNTPHSVPNLAFYDVAVTLDGRFAQGVGGNRIHGGFYGEGHAEAAGAFEQLDVVGAFGATREAGQ